MIKNLYILPRLFQALTVVIIIIVASLLYTPIYYVGLSILFVTVLLLGIDIYNLLIISKKISGERTMSDKLSLGDFQDIHYTIRNDNNTAYNYELFDELPYQFQQREGLSSGRLNALDKKKINSTIYPTERGDYAFGNLILYVSSMKIGFVQWRIILDKPHNVKVYPSILQMEKYSLYVMYKAAHLYGIRKIRTIGENDEFEQIRNYQVGDNPKSINWKATSKHGDLLVNQYQDTRSQNVYCIIDKGRTMEMPFNNLSLLDYAINAALVISNIALRKYDKAGLITFCNKIDNTINAEASSKQLKTILEVLYDQESVFKESNFELLYLHVRKKITKRSILFLYTNFESSADLNRNLEYLRLISKQHILVVIMFVNTELALKTETPAQDVSSIYAQTIAQSLLYEKEEIAREFNKYGIQTILTKPESLTINVINKYLELKARRVK